MNEKPTIRDVGYRTLLDRGRRFDFSIAWIGETAPLIIVEVSGDLFRGPDRLAIQEGAGICYQTLRSRIDAHAPIGGAAFSLNSADAAQHRKLTKPAGGGTEW